MQLLRHQLAFLLVLYALFVTVDSRSVQTSVQLVDVVLLKWNESTPTSAEEFNATDTGENGNSTAAIAKVVEPTTTPNDNNPLLIIVFTKSSSGQSTEVTTNTSSTASSSGLPNSNSTEIINNNDDGDGEIGSDELQLLNFVEHSTNISMSIPFPDTKNSTVTPFPTPDSPSDLLQESDDLSLPCSNDTILESVDIDIEIIDELELELEPFSNTTTTTTTTGTTTTSTTSAPVSTSTPAPTSTTAAAISISRNDSNTSTNGIKNSRPTPTPPPPCTRARARVPAEKMDNHNHLLKKQPAPGPSEGAPASLNASASQSQNHNHSQSESVGLSQAHNRSRSEPDFSSSAVVTLHLNPVVMDSESNKENISISMNASSPSTTTATKPAVLVANTNANANLSKPLPLLVDVQDLNQTTTTTTPRPSVAPTLASQQHQQQQDQFQDEDEDSNELKPPRIKGTKIKVDSEHLLDLMFPDFPVNGVVPSTITSTTRPEIDFDPLVSNTILNKDFDSDSHHQNSGGSNSLSSSWRRIFTPGGFKRKRIESSSSSGSGRSSGSSSSGSYLASRGRRVDKTWLPVHVDEFLTDEAWPRTEASIVFEVGADSLKNVAKAELIVHVEQPDSGRLMPYMLYGKYETFNSSAKSRKKHTESPSTLLDVQTLTREQSIASFSVTRFIDDIVGDFAKISMVRLSYSIRRQLDFTSNNTLLEVETTPTNYLPILVEDVFAPHFFKVHYVQNCWKTRARVLNPKFYGNATYEWVDGRSATVDNAVLLDVFRTRTRAAGRMLDLDY